MFFASSISRGTILFQDSTYKRPPFNKKYFSSVSVEEFK